MTQDFRRRQFPARNPLANALVVVVGAIVIAVSFVLGVFAIVALASAVIVLAAIVGVRVWWLQRKAGARLKNHVNQNGGPTAGGEVIEGEFRVVGPDNGQESAD